MLVVVLGLSVVTGSPPVAADPSPGECEALTSAQVGDPSTVITGKTPADPEAFDCYVLPDGAGAIYRFGLLDYNTDRSITIRDGNGDEVCNPRADCRLVGAGPFTVRISGTEIYNRYDYWLQPLRITGANSCPAQALTEYGSADNAFRADGMLQGLRCWKIDVPEGPILNTAWTDWVIYTPGGERVCDLRRGDQRELQFCRTSYTGPGLLVLEVPANGPVLMSVLAARDTAGCGGSVDTGWDHAAAQVPAETGKVDCRPIAAAAGARVLPRANYGQVGAAWAILNGDFEHICAEVTVLAVGQSLGCRLDGPPPYRMLSWSATPDPGDPTTYPLVARTLNPGTGCPMVQVTPWSAAPADRHAGNGCRQFRATQGQSFVFGTVGVGDEGGALRETYVVDQAGTIVCIGPDSWLPNQVPVSDQCLSMEAGTYVAITDPIASDHVTMLYDRRSFAGCRPQPPTMRLVVTPVSPGQLDCYRVAYPRAGVLAYWDPGLASIQAAEFETPAQVFRADGSDLNEEPCRFALFCLQRSDGPHRLIVGDGIVPQNVFTQYTVDDLTDCQRLRRGVTEVELDDPEQFVCVRIDKIATWNEVIEMSTEDASINSYQARQAIGGVTSCYDVIVDNMPQRALQCGPGDGSSSSFVLLLGHETPQTVTFVRDAPVVRNTTIPRILGVPRPGRTVRATPGTWAPSKVELTYQWAVGGRVIKGATTRSLRLRPAFVGERVTVTVTGRKTEHYQDTARSRQVLVRR